MARPKNLLQSHKLRITITDELWKELEELVRVGRFGRNVYDAIDRILPDAVDAAFAKSRSSLENKQVVNTLLRTKAARAVRK